MPISFHVGYIICVIIENKHKMGALFSSLIKNMPISFHVEYITCVIIENKHNSAHGNNPRNKTKYDILFKKCFTKLHIVIGFSVFRVIQ